MTPASSAADIVIAASVPSEQSSHRAAAPSVPSSYAVGRRSGKRAVRAPLKLLLLQGKERIGRNSMEVEKVKCECCGFTEECTPAYIAAVRAEYLGRWVCGLCAEAVGDEIRREGTLTTAEALDRHVAFARAPRARSRKASSAAAEDDLVAAVARLLRRCLDSPPASPAAPAPPQSRKVAAGPGCPDGTDA